MIFIIKILRQGNKLKRFVKSECPHCGCVFERKLKKVLIEKNIDSKNLLEALISKGITWHCGGMSDPFQPIEKELGITKKLIDLSNKYGISILFSTKSDSVYGANINPKLHSFQLSITNVENRKDIEPNAPSIENRLKFFKELKKKGFIKLKSKIRVSRLN